MESIVQMNHGLKRLLTVVDMAQIMDSFGWDAQSRVPRVPDSLKEGMTMGVQLMLDIDDRLLRGFLPLETPFQVGPPGCTIEEFVSQPLHDAPFTHVLGRILEGDVNHLDSSGRHPQGETIAWMLAEANRIPFLIPLYADGQVDFTLPPKGTLIHACGLLECLPSFSVAKLGTQINTRVLESSRCVSSGSETRRMWGFLRLEIDPSIAKPEFSLTFVHDKKGDTKR